MKLPFYKMVNLNFISRHTFRGFTPQWVLASFLCLFIFQNGLSQSGYTSRTVLLEDREKSVQARVSVHVRAWVNPGHIVEIVKGNIPLWKSNTGVLSVTFDCSPENLGAYNIKVFSSSESGAFREKSKPANNWCGGREEFDIIKTGRHKLGLTLTFNKGGTELDSKTLSFDLNVIGFDEENGLVRIKQITGENAKFTPKEKLVSLVEFIETFQKYPEGGTRSRRIRQDMEGLYQRIDWLEDQMSTQIDPMDMEEVKAYYQTMIQSSFPSLKKFHTKAQRMVDQLDDLHWRKALDSESFEGIEAYRNEFCPQWETAGFTCSHKEEMETQLSLLLDQKLREVKRHPGKEFWCLILKQLENSDYYDKVKYQKKVRDIEENCTGSPGSTVLPGQPSPQFDPCEGLCERARSASKIRTQYELWLRVKNECTGASCYNEALNALEELQAEIACLNSWDQLQELVNQVVNDPGKRQEVVQFAEQLGRNCPNLLPQTEKVLADFDQVRIAEQVNVGDNLIKITFEAGKGIYVDPKSDTTETLSFTDEPIEGWAVPDKEFYVQVWDNNSHTLIFRDKWGNQIETEVSRLGFVWEGFQQEGDKLQFTLKGGREPFVLEFYTSDESLGKRPVYVHSLGDSRSLSLAKSSLPPDIDGMYFLRVKDRFKNVGKESEGELAGYRTESLQIDRPWKAQAWMFLLPVLLMVSGFIFYRNSSFGRPY